MKKISIALMLLISLGASSQNWPSGVKIGGYQITTISNDSTLTNQSATKAITEWAVKKLIKGRFDNLIHVPALSGGKFLYTNGATAYWQTMDTGMISQFYLKVRAAQLSGGGGGTWGSITGTLSDQTDLWAALNGKEATIAAGTTGQYRRGDNSWQTLDKAAVGLSNVPNTDATNASNISSGTLNDARLSGNVIKAADTGVFARKALYVNLQTSSYTLVLTDAGGYVSVSNATANTLTVPPNSSVAYPIGTIITFDQGGAGQCTITPGSGVSLNSPYGALKTNIQYSPVTLLKVATDTWRVWGDLTL